MDTLLMTRADVASLLTIEECMEAVGKAFCLYARRKALPPKVMGIHCDNGGFHIKAGILGFERDYFVAKVNANFPGNPKQHGLPTIQGVVVVCDGVDGRLLALMDSIEITIIRTGAATGVAASCLAIQNAEVATICGCGNQGRISFKALLTSRKIKKLFVFDIDRNQVEKFIQEFGNQLSITAIEKDELSKALQQSNIVVTCTTSKEPFIRAEDIRPGTFIAAVGADSEDKCELFPELPAHNKLVTDITDQCVSIGELHHAIENKLMMPFEVHAELGEILAQQKPGRVSDDEIIIFDSTGTALQDVAAAAIVYEKALAKGIGSKLNFSRQGSVNPGNLKRSERDIEALKWWYPFK